MEENEQNYEPEIDEYQLDENTDTDSSFTASDSAVISKPPRQFITRKTILIAIGVVVVGLSLFKLVGVFFAHDQSKTQATVASAPPPITQASAPATQASQPQQTTQDNDYSDELAALQSGATQSSSQITNIENQINTLTSTVNSIQSNVAAVTTQLQAIASSLQQQQAQLASLLVKAKPPKQSIAKPKQPAVTPVAYSIQAMVPGRAWLIGADGGTITVAVGDYLVGYGKVISINPLRGTVSTSNGAIIKYTGN